MTTQYQPLLSNAVALGTSCGCCVVDVFADASPSVASWFIELASNHSLNGAFAASLHFDSLARFEIPLVCSEDPVRKHYDRMLEGGRSPSEHARRTQPQQIGMVLADSTRTSSNRLRFNNRKGLVLAALTPEVETRDCGARRPAAAFYMLVTASNVDFLEDSYAVVGQLSEGGEAFLMKLQTRWSKPPSDASGRTVVVHPLRLTRIKHAEVLGSCDGVARLAEERDAKWIGGCDCPVVPTRNRQKILEWKVNPHWNPDGLLTSDDETTAPARDADTERRRRQLDVTRSLMLNILDGITDSSIEPPETVLFICKLNPITDSEGLKMCFTQFGEVIDAEVIRDKQGNSRCYAFVEFKTKESCDRAFQKMDRAIVDDSRIHVDYSQSVSKLWAARRHGKRERSD